MAQSTHDLEFTFDRVTKRYRRWDGGEPGREWQALTLLDRHAPGLAPQPIRRDTTKGRPFVVMSLLPGEPLGDTPLTERQVAAAGAALVTLHSAMPADPADPVDPAANRNPERTLMRQAARLLDLLGA